MKQFKACIYRSKTPNCAVLNPILEDSIIRKLVDSMNDVPNYYERKKLTDCFGIDFTVIPLF